MQSFRFTVKDCTFHDEVVEAPTFDAAVEIIRERWAAGELNGGRGYVVLLDQGEDELEEFACW